MKAGHLLKSGWLFNLAWINRALRASCVGFLLQ